MKFIENIDFYIDQYDVEKQIFLTGEIVHKRGWLTKEEFLKFCLWKSRRPKKWYNLNTAEEIKTKTQAAFNEEDERKKIICLTDLKGVNIPTASAILSIVNPKSYPIIDVRCIQSLTELNLISWKTTTIKNWLEYLKIIRALAESNNKTAREIEKALFSYNRMNLDEQYRNLY